MLLQVAGDGGPLRGGAPIVVPASGLLFTFDAAAGVSTSGANVTAQGDQSGNGNNLVALATPATFTANSVNGNPGITSTGAANQGLQNTTVTLAANNSPRTYICVVKPAADIAGMVFDWRRGANDFHLGLGYAGSFFIYGNSTSNASVSSGAAGNGIPLLAEWTSDGTNVALTMNGVVQPITVPGVSGGDNGAAGFISGNYYGGDLAFIGDKLWEAGWNRVLTGAELTAIRTQIAARFGFAVGVNLAIGASSLTVAPSANQTFTAINGVAPYTFSLLTNNSGGSIVGATGVYTAGITGNVLDVVKVTDSLGFVSTANISVTSTVKKTHIVATNRVLGLGDSTASVANGTAWYSTAFITSVNAALSPGSITMIDGGHPGKQSADILTNFASWVTANTPDVVYLTIGINDILSNVPTYKFASNISQIITQILAGTATRVAVTSITMDGEVWSTGPVWGVNAAGIDAKIDAYNVVLESIVNGLNNPNVIFVNFRQQLLTWEVTNNPGKTTPGHASVDGIHPNATGITLESGYAFAQVVAP